MNTTVNCSYFSTEMFGQQITFHLCWSSKALYADVSVRSVVTTVADGVEAKAMKAQWKCCDLCYGCVESTCIHSDDMRMLHHVKTYTIIIVNNGTVLLSTEIFENALLQFLVKYIVTVFSVFRHEDLAQLLLLFMTVHARHKLQSNCNNYYIFKEDLCEYC